MRSSPAQQRALGSGCADCTHRRPPIAGCSNRSGTTGCSRSSNSCSRAGRWRDMGTLIDDTLLHHLALVGTPEEMPRLVHGRFGDRLDRVSSYYGWSIEDPERLAAIIAAFRATVLHRRERHDARRSHGHRAAALRLLRLRRAGRASTSSPSSSPRMSSSTTASAGSFAVGPR